MIFLIGVSIMSISKILTAAVRVGIRKQRSSRLDPRGNGPVELGSIVLKEVYVKVLPFLVLKILKKLAFPPFINNIVDD